MNEDFISGITVSFALLNFDGKITHHLIKYYSLVLLSLQLGQIHVLTFYPV